MTEALFKNLSGKSSPTERWAGALLHALARDEAVGRRPDRLTESRMATWNRFRGRLSATDFVSLLFEDAAVLHRVPFDASAIGGSLRVDRISDSIAQAWLDTIPSLDLSENSADYIVNQAKLLGLPTRMARSDLHVVKSHQKVLELPGTGGQLAHHLVSSQSDITLQDNITVACDSWQELTLAGIIALDLAVPDTNFIVKTETSALRESNNPLRQRKFDFVVGLHPDKGGFFRAEDQLDIWFSGAKILLV